MKTAACLISVCAITLFSFVASRPTSTGPSAVPSSTVSAGSSRSTAKPWDEVFPEVIDTILGSGFTDESVVRTLCDWNAEGRYRPDPVPAAILGGHAELTAEQRVEFDAIADQFDAELEVIGTSVVAELRSALQETLTRGEFVHIPVEGEGTPEIIKKVLTRPPSADFHYSDAFTRGGWYVGIRVDSSMYPEYGRRMQALEEAKLDRAIALYSFVRSLDGGLEVLSER